MRLILDDLGIMNELGVNWCQLLLTPSDPNGSDIVVLNFKKSRSKRIWIFEASTASTPDLHS